MSRKKEMMNQKKSQKLSTAPTLGAPGVAGLTRSG
jgi:hypothetical protein